MKHISWVFTLLIILVSVTGIFSLKQAVSAQGAQENYEPAATIQAAKVEFTDFQPSHTVLGESVAIKQVMLKNERSGKITFLNLDPSKTVAMNQILVRIDDSEEVAQLASAQATATLKFKMLERIKSLYKDQRISQDKLDIATAELAIAQSNMALIEANIAKKTIRAPFNAHVGLHTLAVGQTLEVNSNIAQLIGVNENIWIDFKVPQVYSALAIGQSITISLTTDALTTQATIISSSPSLSSRSRQVHYRAQLSLHELPIKPQYLVNVTLPIAASMSSIIVPNSAITRDQLGEYVYVINKEANNNFRAARRQVILGERTTQGVVIDTGLSTGETIATMGAFKLYDGMKVMIEKSPLDDISQFSETGGLR